MSKLMCITNRTLCGDDFLSRLEKIAACSPRGIILREKDLPKEEYRSLAAKVMEICRRHGVLCILHSFPETAADLKAEAVHLPLPVLRQLPEDQKNRFRILGASCHSAEEAQEAQGLGCTYLIAGHIFATDCKKGVPPRGLDFLQQVCRAVSLPVYAIGGISSQNVASVLEAGAQGGCVMSGLMKCPEVEKFMEDFEKAGKSHDVLPG